MVGQRPVTVCVVQVVAASLENDANWLRFCFPENLVPCDTDSFTFVASVTMSRVLATVSDPCALVQWVILMSFGYVGTRSRRDIISGVSYGRRPYVTMGPNLTPMVKYLVIVCALTFVLFKVGAGAEMTLIFGLTSYAVLEKLFVWQLFTYIFLHGGFWHLFWNMFVLWMFGCELERYWGGKEFLRFFLVTGVGAGTLSVLFDPLGQVPTIGASGSVYGILMAYGMLFPERLVYLYFLFPIKVKYFVAFLGAIAFFSTLNSSGSTIAHMAHLGGMIFAFLYLKGWLSWSSLRQSYFRWKLRRMRERFKVYEKKPPNREDDFWIH